MHPYELVDLDHGLTSLWKFDSLELIEGDFVTD